MQDDPGAVGELACTARSMKSASDLIKLHSQQAAPFARISWQLIHWCCRSCSALWAPRVFPAPQLLVSLGGIEPVCSVSGQHLVMAQP